jgi:hypothetical protein
MKKKRGFRSIMTFFDLKSGLLNSHTPETPKNEMANEPRKNYFLSDYGFYPHQLF